jgi:hypothetical protein
MKLFTIGDSSAHGFMSLAAAQTELCFSTRIARILGAAEQYRFPHWPLGGLPINLEHVLRELDRRFGPDIKGPIEWTRALFEVASSLDEVEAYYERGAGAYDAPYPGGVTSFHNVAVRGFEVADAWLVTPRVCRAFLSKESPRRDDLGAGPSDSFHRTAFRVLNPAADPLYDDFSAIDWLSHHVRQEGVENTLVWLGSNNALGVVLKLKLDRTPNDPSRRTHTLTHAQRMEQAYNLWHPDDFHAEFAELLARLTAAQMGNRHSDWKVFLGNVPFVTIAPLAKGVGETVRVKSAFPNIDGKIYFKYYVYFPFEEEDVREGVGKLTLQDALQIDEFIARYNVSIQLLVDQENERLGAQHYHVVDLERSLADLAWKRNAGSPSYVLPAYLHDLLPRPNTKMYHGTRDGRLESGGLFSLDGVHPSAIGQGLIALEYLKVMQQAGVAGADPLGLPWPEIVREDSLYSRPIRIMSELRENKDLIQWLVTLFQLSASKR